MPAPALGALSAEPDPGLVHAIRTSPNALALIDLAERRVVAASDTSWRLLGAPSPPPADLDPTSLSEHPQLARDTLALLATGGIESYQACRRMHRLSGGLLETSLWVQVLDDERRWAVLTFSPKPGAGSSPDVDQPAPPAGPVTEVVVGAVDHDWVVSRISSEVDHLLGAPAEECRGRPFLGFVHPDDAPVFLAAASRVRETGAGAGAHARLRAGSGPWHLVSMIIAPSEDPSAAFCFALTALDPRPRTDDDRVADLEHRLWNIALEVRAAGVLGAVEQLPDPATLPGLTDLTSRQWEVLSRLLRGQRVPAIAREMFLSPSTVRNHLSTIFKKTGVHSQEELLELFRKGADQLGGGGTL